VQVCLPFCAGFGYDANFIGVARRPVEAHGIFPTRPSKEIVLIRSLCCLLSIALLFGTAGAADPAPDADATRLEIGFEERVRSENMENLSDWDDSHSDTRQWWRFRSRFWTKLNVGRRAEFYLGLNNENRKVTEPDTEFRFDEVIVENLYVNLALTPQLSVKVGRQNLVRGEGFMFIEGNPLDGSRTAYFNAVDVAWSPVKDLKLELIGISNPDHDIYLPRINDKHKALIDWDEEAVGVYATDRTRRGQSLDAYYFYKRESGDPRDPADPQYQPERRVHTLGGRLEQSLGGGWSAAGELAGQWGGQHPDTPIRAMGGYTWVRKTFSHAWKPTTQVGYWRFSGDDPDTPANENWDPLFNRWPAWSELYIYSQWPEKGLAYWTNTGMWQAEATVTPWRTVKARATYYHLSASHPYPGDPGLFAGGTHRGDMFQVRVDVAPNSSWRGHVVFERFWPGSFYTGDSPGYFFRFEIIYTIKGAFAWN